MLELTEQGLYCAAGSFHIDPWKPVPRAVITHAHADHARAGCDAYLASAEGEAVLRRRLGNEVVLETLSWGETKTLGSVVVSLHPAGHILGSAQVRVEGRAKGEHQGRVVVVSGDYKTDPDPTCTPFEPVPCDLFVTESTFGLPIFRWPSEEQVLSEVRTWWSGNREAGRASLLLAYSLGKAQRVLAGLLDAEGPIYTHGAVEGMNELYREGGRALPETRWVSELEDDVDFSEALIVAPPGAAGSSWTRRFGPHSKGMTSGWMRIRGPRRRRAIDRGFIFSDHADWPGLLDAIAATGAEEIWVTHGYRQALARFLTEQGLDAKVLATEFDATHEAEWEAAE